MPEDFDSVLFFELRHKIKGREQPSKYWTCLSVSDMDKGRVSLQLYKAPVERCLARQRKQPKKDCALWVVVH